MVFYVVDIDDGDRTPAVWRSGASLHGEASARFVAEGVRHPREARRIRRVDLGEGWTEDPKDPGFARHVSGAEVLPSRVPGLFPYRQTHDGVIRTSGGGRWSARWLALGCPLELGEVVG